MLRVAHSWHMYRQELRRSFSRLRRRSFYSHSQVRHHKRHLGRANLTHHHTHQTAAFSCSFVLVSCVCGGGVQLRCMLPRLILYLPFYMLPLPSFPLYWKWKEEDGAEARPADPTLESVDPRARRQQAPRHQGPPACLLAQQHRPPRLLPLYPTLRVDPSISSRISKKRRSTC